MIIGIPKEIKIHEYRVALTPMAVATLVGAGHSVIVERDAGKGAGFEDDDYGVAGAILADSAQQVYGDCDLIVKVKEPQLAECKMMRPGQLLFAFLHLAANPEQAQLLMASAATCLAFETLADSSGSLPLLAPMSEIAGRLSVQAGAVQLQREHGGRGVLLSGATGVPPARVTVIGGGTVGINAATIALAMGADVSIVELSQQRRLWLDRYFQSRVSCVPSSAETILEQVAQTDLLIGAVLVPGDKAPKVVSSNHIKAMNPGTVFVDVAIDQGGCGETSKLTSYDNPTYRVDEVIHYCVGNLPAAVPRTATQALSAALLPKVLALAAAGVDNIAADNSVFISAVNIHKGKIVNRAVKHALSIA
ncbi:MAG: alanine dehydrogenase [Porticoccaceae bacterium]|nr:alanine dehydrogenase [Porticoccaceae bacterium]